MSGKKTKNKLTRVFGLVDLFVLLNLFFLSRKSKNSTELWTFELSVDRVSEMLLKCKRTVSIKLIELS